MVGNMLCTSLGIGPAHIIDRLADFADSLHLIFVPMPPSETFLTDAAYVDANHLNRAGAHRLSALLVGRLSAAGYFDA